MLRLALLAGVFVGFSVVVMLAYRREWQWTGLPAARGVGGNADDRPAKTLWDWLQLLGIPLALASLAFLLNAAQSSREQQHEDQRATLQGELEHRRAAQQDARVVDADSENTLQSYLAQMSDLMLDRRLLRSKPEADVREIAHTATLTAVRRLDGPRRGLVVRFLAEAQLLRYTANVSQTGLAPGQAAGPVAEADLAHAGLRGARLSRVNLSAADLRGANLREASLDKARLVATDLRGANLREALLSKANLSEAKLRGANLTEANLTEANLSYARLMGAKLRGANLNGTDVDGAHLGNALLAGASFIHASLREADLTGADLAGADLTGADLAEANLAEADLGGADLTGANLTGANLTGARNVDITGSRGTPAHAP
jgi:uncharacterized protein YjbI with pentapeptide repeats